MKILQLCKKFPFPLKDGESIAVTNLSKALAANGCQLTLLSMNTSKHYVDISTLPHAFSHYDDIHTVYIDNQIKPLEAFFNLFSRKSYHVTRFVSEDFRKKLQDILANDDYDIILLETAYLAPYLEDIRSYSKAKVVMRAHNVEHEIWKRAATNSPFSLKKWYLHYAANKLKRFELKMLNTYDFLVPISEKDLLKYRKLGYANGAEAVPIGLDLSLYKAKPIVDSKRPSMSFIGSLDWLPNFEGLNWFVQEVIPVMRSKHPGIELHVAGRNNTGKIVANPSITMHGEVENAREFLNDHPIMIVPLRSGSGMRAKIIEAMALGRIVITTTLGLEGIEARDGEEVLVADTPDEYLLAYEKCLKNPKFVRHMSLNAQRFVSERYDHNLLATQFKNILSDYLQHRKMAENEYIG